MHQQDLRVIYGTVAGLAVLTAFLSNLVMKRHPLSRQPYWFLLVLDAFLLGLFIYVSGGVDGPFIIFLLVHSIAYGFYLGVRGGLAAAGTGIIVTVFFSILALNSPVTGTTMSSLIATLMQSGQLKISTSYIALRILVNGLLMFSGGIASGVLAQSLYTESGHLQRVLDNLAELRARSRQILDSLHDGVVVVGAQGETISVNPAASELLATDRPIEESALGSIVHDFQKNRDFPSVMDIVVGERIIECKFSQYGEDGGTIVILTDATDLRNYRAALEERDKLSLIGKLSATMAHEIRNPLASMSGAAQMLATGKLEKDKAERMAVLVDKQAKRVSELIEGYLSLSRSSKDFPFTRVDINSLVTDSIESAMHGFAGGVSIELRCSEKTPYAMGNRVRLGQVLWNVLRNSVEAMNSTQTPLIQVESRINEDDGSVSIVVGDNGPGIAENFMDRIWEPFCTSRDDGTGLGLYIVRRVIQEHNGTVEAVNRIEGGALFEIRLPGAGDMQDG